MSSRRKPRREEAVQQLAGWIPQRERKIILRQLERTPAAGRDAAVQMALACMKAQQRTQVKAAQDAASDADRRTLVGARLPRSVADRVRAQAEKRDISVYRWIQEAVLTQLIEQESGRPSPSRIGKALASIVEEEAPWGLGAVCVEVSAAADQAAAAGAERLSIILEALAASLETKEPEAQA